MKKLFLLLGLLIYSLLTSIPGFSQFSASEAKNNYKNSKASERGLDRYRRYTSIGGSLNAFNYYGDLAPWQGKLSTDISYTRPGIGFVAMRRVAPRISLRGTYTFGRLRADDFSADYTVESSRYRYRRNLHFRSDIHEFGFTGIFDFIKNRNDFDQRPLLVPYAFVGIAIFHHNPKAQIPVFSVDEKPEWIALQPLQTEGVHYSRVQFATPIGVGARLKLHSRLDLSLEVGLRQLYTDYIDDASTGYLDPAMYKSEVSYLMAARAAEPIAAAERKQRDAANVAHAQNFIPYVSIDGNTYAVSPVNAPGARRGNPNDNDIYVVTSLQLTYVILPKMYRAKHRI
ncbi:MAG: DUF6089 family protein [Bacteroidota bacterium]|nr:DUF6089 family protein [Bacteroidota bacterium]